MKHFFVRHGDSALPSKIMKDFFDGKVFPPCFAGKIDNDEGLRLIYTERKNNYSSETRSIVHECILNQNKSLNASEKANLHAFAKGACTITTGHQLIYSWLDVIGIFCWRWWH